MGGWSSPLMGPRKKKDHKAKGKNHFQRPSMMKRNDAHSEDVIHWHVRSMTFWANLLMHVMLCYIPVCPRQSSRLTSWRYWQEKVIFNYRNIRRIRRRKVFELCPLLNATRPESQKIRKHKFTYLVLSIWRRFRLAEVLAVREWRCTASLTSVLVPRSSRRDAVACQEGAVLSSVSSRRLYSETQPPW